MTSPFRFDGTGEPETEEERRKRQLREAMRAAQLGLPLASQLPAVTITAPRSSMLDASARRTADITAAFESALAETERRRQSPMERLAGFEMPEVAPDVTAAPTGRTRRRPATISEQPESLLSKAVNVAAQIPVQSMLAGGRMREAVESTPLGRLTPGTAAGARLTQEAVEERFGPRSGLARAVAVPAAFAGEVVPYFAAGAGIPGLLRSAAITGLTSQRPGGSTVEALGELSGSETLKRLAESPLRTAADVGLDVGINVLPGAVSGLTRGFREAARITGGGVGTTRALARQAAQNIAEGARQVGPAARAVGQQLAAEPLTTAALAASVAGEAAVPGAGLLAAALPATTRRAGETFPDKLFSRLERAITAAPFEKGTPQQWQAALSKGVAAGEREWVGIDDFLKNSQSPTLTKAEVLGQFEQGKIRLGETVYSEEAKKRFLEVQNQYDEEKAKQLPRFLEQFNVPELERVNEEASKKLTAFLDNPQMNRLAKNAEDAWYRFKLGPNPKMWDPSYRSYEQKLFNELVDYNGMTFEPNGALRSWKERFDVSQMPAQDVNAIDSYIAMRNDPEWKSTRRNLINAAQDSGIAFRAARADAEYELEKYLAPEWRSKIEAVGVSPKYQSYTQPGPKENYREVVLTLDGQDATDTYRSSHWAMNNPLVHVRMTDRALPSGEKALFVEEIQSDWHQAGRKEGYKKPSEFNQQIEELKALRAQALADGDEREARFLAEQMQDIRDEMRELGRAVPEAPFKKTQEWAELGLKRAIQEAVDKGYDRVVMVRGQQAADNFDLSRQIDELQWRTEDGGKTFALASPDNDIAKGIPADKLSDYVGKDVAERITYDARISTTTSAMAQGTMRGVDLQVGGEGMKAFYDKIVPNTLRDLGKSMGLKIELEPVKLFTDGDNLSFRITPEVRQKVQTEGMRLYDVTGAVPEALRYALRPAVAPVVGAAVGATQVEENRLAGAVVGAAAGAGTVAGIRGAKMVAQAARDLRASGLPATAAQAMVLAQRGIDYSGKGAERVFRLAKGNIFERLKKGVEAAVDPVRIIEKYGLAAEKAGKAPETSVATMLNEALSSDVTAARAIAHGAGVERGGIISPITREIIGEPLEDVFKPLGGSPIKNTQATTYALALRFLGRYDEAAAKLRQWDTLAADAAREAEQNLPTRPAAGVDDPALAERLRAEGARKATEALGPRPNPLQVYGGDQARLEADRQIVAILGQKPEFVEFAQRLERYFDNLTRYAVESGLWTPEFAARIRNSDAFYIPVKRLREVGGARGGPMTGRVTPGRVGPGVQRFTGSNLMIGNPVETIANYTQALIRRADMYRVSNALIDDALFTNSPLITRIATEDPRAKTAAVAEIETAYRNMGLSEEEARNMSDLFMRFDKDNPVIWRNGPQGKEFFLLNDPWVYTGLRSINPQTPEAYRAILMVLGPGKRLATAAATGMNPAFWTATNVPRDVLTATGNVPGLTVQDAATGIAEAVKSLAARSGRVEELGRFGAGTVSMYGPEAQNVAAIARRIAPTGETPIKAWGGKIGRELARTGGMPLRAMERVGRATEIPMRIAAAERAAQDAAARGLSPRAQNALASRAFANATVDFRRKSAYAFDRMLEGAMPFYGAAKKGALWTARAAKNNPKTAMALTGVITLGTVLEYLTSDDKDRQEFVDRPASQRARYLHIGPTRFALPQEYAAIAAATRLGLAQVKNDDPFAFEQFKEAMMNILPPGFSDVARGGAVGLLPFPVIQGALEIQQNRSTFTGQPIVPQSMERLLPEARRRETTAPTFDVMARAGRALGLEQFSPLQAEYLTRDLLGGFTDVATAITDVAAAPLAQRQAAGRVPLPFLRQPLNPLAGYATRPVTRGQSEDAFYEARTQFQQADATLTDLGKRAVQAEEQQNTAALQNIAKELQALQSASPLVAQLLQPGVLDAYRSAITGTDDALKALREQRQQIVADFANKRITSSRARAMIDSLDVERARTLREVYGLLRQVMPE